MKLSYQRHDLNFKKPSGTSRGILTQKETWLIKLESEGKTGLGECGILRSLSFDDRPDYEATLEWVANNIHLGLDLLWEKLLEFPSIQFGLEQAFKSLESDDGMILFPSDFTSGKAAIAINGLIWMEDEAGMKSQIDDKIKEGFNCVKLKIGAIDFESELRLLRYIRTQFTAEEIELRVDANGGFDYSDALNNLFKLSEFQLHSIEQPIKTKQYDSMAELCEATPLPIALDEELIGVIKFNDKKKLLDKIQPQFIILKPSLVGGFRGCTEWIELAEARGIGWWITSALESNIGLNAIAQWTFTLNNNMPQGLGTGSLYTNNFESPLVVQKGQLWYDPFLKWSLPSWR
ncbi:o-succinylbenzoate synthase [Flavobacterium sp. NKUCC04_CG]|uniref:o-succinylbenzoate synthase n=1 Tax=Flavobacterium sp. NKUCC04_CG TaxID=2842121 RepID=UPI001C5B4A5C|nr:o-succinylbenzoate synthase [Flavobacterium sp. NKUCC04_CG]MBW3517932.1 o-succinylbenzoate synthase [Flavobacterium sp. NKUCC04_CG]